nr:hypothetical protein [uncultured Duganella sp.]
MKQLFGKPWFILLFWTVLTAVSVGLIKGWATSTNQWIAGGLLGFSLGVAILVDLSFCRSKWLVTFLNGIVGALTGVAIAYILGKSSDVIIWYLLGGAILGASARIWIRYVNF